MDKTPTLVSSLPREGTLTVPQIADDLQLTEPTVRGYIASKRIPGGAKFWQWRVDAQAYHAWRDQEFGAAPKDPHVFTPRSVRSEASRRGSQARTKPDHNK